MDPLDDSALLSCKCDERHCNEPICKTDGVCFASVVFNIKDSKISNSYRSGFFATL